MNGNKRWIRLLLVDDEVEFLTSTARALSRRGFDVRIAQNGTSALKILEDETFDVVVLDVKMPDISGDQLFREAKERWPNIPIIMLTGHGTVQQAFETSREGVFDYLTKPCDIDKLAEIACKAVEEYKRAGTSEPDWIEDDEIRLLVVDDEQELLQSLSSTLSRRSMHVVTAQSSVEALSLIDNHIFDVALVDVKMPKIDGVILLHLIKKAQPACEVILFTGYPSIEIAVKGVADGAFDYLVKPQDLTTLTSKIREAYKQNRLRAADEKRSKIDEIRNRRRD